MKNIKDTGENITIKKIKETDTSGSFSISGLYPGYGLTIANSLRRILLSSIPGAAITFIKIKGIDHEFSTIPGMVEDIIELSLNLKKVKVRSFSDEPQVLTLKIKGEQEVTAGDIKTNSNVEIINPDQHLATLSAKNSELDMELTIETGLGYALAERRQGEKLAIGVIALDAFFSPVLSVNYGVEHIRVGDRTDYNQVKLDIETDGSVSPEAALLQASSILEDHFHAIVESLGGSSNSELTNSSESEESKEIKEDEEQD